MTYAILTEGLDTQGRRSFDATLLETPSETRRRLSRIAAPHRPEAKAGDESGSRPSPPIPASALPILKAFGMRR